MTAGEKLIQQGVLKGLEQGREQGELKGRRETLLKQIRLRFGALSSEDDALVMEATEAQLEFWTERVLTAASLDEFFER